MTLDFVNHPSIPAGEPFSRRMDQMTVTKSLQTQGFWKDATDSIPGLTRMWDPARALVGHCPGADLTPITTCFIRLIWMVKLA